MAPFPNNGIDGLYQDSTDPDYSEPAGELKWLDGKEKLE